MSKKTFSLLVILALLLGAIPAMAQDAEAGGGGTLIGAFDIGPGGAPEVRPYMDTAGRTWLHKIWTPLVSWNSDQSAVAPQLATEWSANEDFTVWTFNLREGVTWHDGEAFTADDVVFSANLALNPEAAVQFASFSQFPQENLVEVRAVDDLTVEMEFSAPAPRLEFAMIMLWILPEHALADLDPADYQITDWFFTEAIGTGPFMHDEYEPDQFWALVPNPNYWEGAPRLDRLINRYFEDETAAVLALESGDIDFTYTSGDVALRLQETGNYQTFSGPSGVTNYYTFNLRNEAFQDVRVRQAFLYSIDRDAIVETVFQGTHEVVPCISPFPSMWPDESELIDYSYDPERAQGLLAEAGYDSSSNFEVVTYYGSQFALDALAAQQSFLSQIGVNVTPLAQDVPTYNSYYYTGEGWDISYRGVLATVGNFPFNFYQPGGFPDLPEDETLIGETFPELIELINAARTEGDFDTYLGLLQDICAFQNQNALEGYMWTSTRFGTSSDRLVDFYWFPSGGGGPYTDDAHLWSVSD
jgi:peptide/nickel transport system substrate-binding protein